ncbi:MAG: hypothetical protein ACREIC_22305 [Limisphaerales bacterium]
MKALFATGAVLVLSLAVWLAYRSGQHAGTGSPAPAARYVSHGGVAGGPSQSPAEKPPAPVSTPAGQPATPDSHVAGTLLPANSLMPALPPELADLPPTTVLENMRRVITQYGEMFGGNPVGTNQEITRALQGDNPKGINFLKADGNRVNANGELVDVWGTPYFFHQLSGTVMEIRSAGPDHRMWTDDDLVIR